jgi:inner membrane protein
MDNITHSLAGALLGQLGLKRASRFAMTACVMGANAPDIDVFAPLLLDVDNIAFHRGPTHALWAPPLLAAAIVGLLWLLDRLWRRPGAAPFRAGPLFVAALLATFSHPFLDWLTTYAVNLFVPFDRGWYSANAIFIIDWVYWLLLIGGIWLTRRRERRGLPQPRRPAAIAAGLLLGYIAANMALSTHAERRTAAVLRERGIEPTLIVASPPPLAFWNRTMAWRSANRWGSGSFRLFGGLSIADEARPLGLDHPQLRQAIAEKRSVRSFLYWSRMPVVVQEPRGGVSLTDQRYYRAFDDPGVPEAIRRRAPTSTFVVPLDPSPRP